MKKNVSKLDSAEQQITEQRQESQNLIPREFASPEDMLRFDAAQVTPPPSIIDRLRETVAAELPAKRSWWRRWFFRDS